MSISREYQVKSAYAATAVRVDDIKNNGVKAQPAIEHAGGRTLLTRAGFNDVSQNSMAHWSRITSLSHVPSTRRQKYRRFISQSVNFFLRRGVLYRFRRIAITQISGSFRTFSLVMVRLVESKIFSRPG